MNGATFTPAPLNDVDETLGGWVGYFTIVCYLKGELEGLVIRCEIGLPSLPISTGADHALSRHLSFTIAYIYHH